MMIVPRRNIDLFDEFFDDPFFHKEERNHSMPMMKTDIRENNKNYIIDIDLPGFDKKDIKIDIEKGYLNIHAKTDNTNKEEEKGKFLRRERYVGECSRSFFIGEDIKEEDIKATFRNGILTLEVPKVEEKKSLPEKKYIEIGE